MDAGKNEKSQVALDFLISYGMALLIIGVAIIVIYELGILNPLLTPVSCSASPGFACGFFTINSSGVLTISIAQSIGSQITVNGASCSTLYNVSGDYPEYGNIHVNSNSIFYPSGYDPSGNVIYSSSNLTMKVYCYNNAGKATGTIGNFYFGHFWLNFTISGYNSITESVATVTTKYA